MPVGEVLETVASHLTELFFHCFSVLGYQVITTPLPTGGPVLVSMLNILEGFNFTEKDQGKSLTYHYILEVGIRLASTGLQLYREKEGESVGYCL